MKNSKSNIVLYDEYNRLLEQFFAADDITELVQKVSTLIPELQTSVTDLSDDYIDRLNTESLLSAKLRQLADRVITFAEKKLENIDYLNFLLELGKLLLTQGELNLSLEMFNRIMTIIGKDENLDGIKAHTLLSIANIHCRQASWNESISYIKKAKSIFEDIESNAGLGKCEFLTGTIFVEKGDLSSAKIRFENSLHYFNPEDNFSDVAMVEINLGIVKYIEGNYDSAGEYFNKGLMAFTNLGDKRRIAELRQNLGMVYNQKKEYEAAIIEFNKCIDISLESRYLQTLGLSYLNMASIHTNLCDFKLAKSFAEKTMEISYQLNDKLSIAETYKIKGMISRKEKDYDSAEDYLLTSLRINRDLKNEMNYAETSFELGLLYKEIEHNGHSEKHFNESLSYYQKINSQTDIAKIEMNMS